MPMERYRGLDDREDHLLAAVTRLELTVGQNVTLVLTTNAHAELDGERALAEHVERERNLCSKWQVSDAQGASAAPAWVRQLILAADQFVVKRSLPGERDGRSIIAGYHWFGDWGRDTMIALPGLTLTTAQTLPREFFSRSPATWTVECCRTIFPTQVGNGNTTPWTQHSGISKQSGNISRQPRTQ